MKNLHWRLIGPYRYGFNKRYHRHFRGFPWTKGLHCGFVTFHAGPENSIVGGVFTRNTLTAFVKTGVQ